MHAGRSDELGPGGSADGGFPRPGVILRCSLQHPGRPEPRHAGARQQRIGGVVPLAEGEHDELLVSGTDRVGVLERDGGRGSRRGRPGTPRSSSPSAWYEKPVPERT